MNSDISVESGESPNLIKDQLLIQNIGKYDPLLQSGTHVKDGPEHTFTGTRKIPVPVEKLD
jgi:hypothetical protein